MYGEHGPRQGPKSDEGPLPLMQACAYVCTGPILVGEGSTIDLLQLCSSTTPHSNRRFVTRRRRPSIPFYLHPSLALAGHHCPAAFSPSDLPPTGRRQPTYFQVDAAQPRADSPGPPSPAGCSRPSAVPSGVIVTARALLRENGELAGASSVCFSVVIFACVWRMP